MKLSEIKGEQTLDVIAELIEPIANIAMDDEASDLFRKKPLPEGMTPGKFMMARAKVAVPKMLKEHKEDLITILSTLSLKARDEYVKDMSILSLISDVVDVLNDEVFAEFFISAQTPEPETSSGSVQENTEAEA